MSTRIHERRHQRDIPIRRAKRPARERNWWGFVRLMNLACDEWLLRRCPGYRAERENRRIVFGNVLLSDRDGGRPDAR